MDLFVKQAPKFLETIAPNQEDPSNSVDITLYKSKENREKNEKYPFFQTNV